MHGWMEDGSRHTSDRDAWAAAPPPLSPHEPRLGDRAGAVAATTSTAPPPSSSSPSPQTLPPAPPPPRPTWPRCRRRSPRRRSPRGPRRLGARPWPAPPPCPRWCRGRTRPWPGCSTPRAPRRRPGARTWGEGREGWVVWRVGDGRGVGTGAALQRLCARTGPACPAQHCTRRLTPPSPSLALPPPPLTSPVIRRPRPAPLTWRRWRCAAGGASAPQRNPTARAWGGEADGSVNGWEVEAVVLCHSRAFAGEAGGRAAAPPRTLPGPAHLNSCASATSVGPRDTLAEQRLKEERILKYSLLADWRRRQAERRHARSEVSKSPQPGPGPSWMLRRTSLPPPLPTCSTRSPEPVTSPSSVSGSQRRAASSATTPSSASSSSRSSWGNEAREVGGGEAGQWL
jgi:hypothetical protein